MVRILHLSDLHFTGAEAVNGLVQPLLNDLHGPLKAGRIDYLVASGDFADKCSDTGYAKAGEFLKVLQEKLKVVPESTVLCPGNHDVDIKLKCYQYEYAAPAGLASNEVVKLSDGGFLVRDRANYALRFERFRKLHLDVAGREYPQELGLQGTVQYFKQTGILFLTLNTAWEIDHRNMERATVNHDALGHALEQCRDHYAEAKLRIAVWHHAIRGQRVIQEQRFLEQVQQAGFRICLHGDIHEEAFESVGKWNGRELYVVGSGSFGQYGEGTPHLYNLLEVAPDLKTVTLSLRAKKTGGAYGAHAVVATDDPQVRTGRYEIVLDGARPAKPKRARKAPSKRVYDPGEYLKWLRGYTKNIDFRGLKAGSKEVEEYPMDDLFIPLMTMANDAPQAARAPVTLDEAVQAHPQLVIQGDAGSGKTTFLRHLAWQRCGADQSESGFPLYLSIARLDTFVHERAGEAGHPVSKDAPKWIGCFLEQESNDKNWGVDRHFFEQRLSEPGTLVLLDGLDEAGSESRREDMARLFEEARRTYSKCRWVVTTRPRAYEGKSTLRDFTVLRILELEEPQIESFLLRWSLCLKGDESAAREHCQDLQKALKNSPWEIRRLARNPLMLSALAVVHYNEKRLPDQRAELYECILGWLAKSRKEKRKQTPDEVLKYYGGLALRMQDYQGKYRTRIGKGAAAEVLTEQFPEKFADGEAEVFLSSDEVNSGIVTSDGNELRFYHRIYQEFLAARYLAALREALRWSEVSPRLFVQEWRETLVLLGGCLKMRGDDVLDQFFEQLLAHGTSRKKLAERARVFGLAGSMLADLRAAKYVLNQKAERDFEGLRKDVMRIFKVDGAPELGVKERAQVADALAQAGDPRLRLPGDPDSGYWVESNGVTIGRYPVTVHEYAKYVDAGGKQPDSWEEQLRTPSRPVTRISWYEANDYCKWVGGVRLPSDQEWERVAAGQGRKNREYPWSSVEPTEDHANFAGNVGHPTAVGLFPKGSTPEGVCDMAGNVLEWTATDYAKERKSVRGCSFNDNASRLRAANRYRFDPDYGYYDLGFRLVRE